MCVGVDSFKYHSEENVSVAVSESSPPVSIGAHCSPQFGPLAPQYHATQYLLPHAATNDEHRSPRNDDHMTSILKQLEQSREMQIELQDAIADIQVYTSPFLCGLFCSYCWPACVLVSTGIPIRDSVCSVWSQLVDELIFSVYISLCFKGHQTAKFCSTQLSGTMTVKLEDVIGSDVMHFWKLLVTWW